MPRWRRITAIGLTIPVLAAGGILANHHIQQLRLDRQWSEHQPRSIEDLGHTEKLRITPLVDWFAEDDELLTDAGVAYLVETDTKTILFDLGNNTDHLDPAPLPHNMAQLGVEFDSIDDIVLSHAHYDHVGGRQWTGGKITGDTFGIGNAQPDLSDKNIWVPTPMTYPGTTAQILREPRKLANGIATTGTIPRQLFIGRIDEQALAVNIGDKGIVLIVGCGHQTVSRLLEHAEEIFDAPLYGIVGGLHYPYPTGRMNTLGINLQRRFASGTGPLSPIGPDEIDAELDQLAAHQPELIAVSPHDSSDEVIADIAARFPDAAQPLKVGSPIEVYADDKSSH